MTYQIIASIMVGLSVANLFYSFEKEKKEQPEIKVTSPTWLPNAYSLDGMPIDVEDLANWLNSKGVSIKYAGAKITVDQQKNEQHYELMFETEKPTKKVVIKK